MTIRHHLTDTLLLTYCGGDLPEAFNLAVAAHLSLCDDCRARLMTLETLGGAVLSETAAAKLHDGSLAATLARLDRAPAPQPQTRVAAGVLPAPLRDYVGGDLEAVKWRSIGLGVRQAILPTERGAIARLLHIPAGQQMPDHGHRGMELTLVLQGAFRDQTDRFGPGDIEIATETLQHTPVAEPGADCICLAVTDAPLKFNALIPRLAQSFFRI